MQLLKLSTAFTFRIGPFLDDTDGKTAETGLTLSQADFRLSKAGGAFAQKHEATSATHDENGWYTCILDTTDTNTVGTLDIAVAEAGALPVWRHFTVMPATVYDSLVAGSDNLPVDMIQIDGLATIGTNATLNLKMLNINNNNGSAISAVSSGNNGHGLYVEGYGAGHGLYALGSDTGNGILAETYNGTGGIVAFGNSGGGYGIYAYSTGANKAAICAKAWLGNAPGMELIGKGSGSGLLLTPGATGCGLNALGGATSGAGIRAYAPTLGDGIRAESAAGTGFTAAGGGNSEGIFATGGLTGNGASFVGGGTSGDGLRLASINGNGLNATGGVAGAGARFYGGSSNGNGLSCEGQGLGDGLEAQGGSPGGHGIEANGGTGAAGLNAFAGTNAPGFDIVGNGAGAGIRVTPGTTGNGITVNGGTMSGYGIYVATTNNHGVVIVGSGAGNHGLALYSANAHGLYATGALNGITALGTAGKDISAKELDNMPLATDTQLSLTHGAGSWLTGGGISAQQTRDAMMLAPTPGAPAAGSVDAHLDEILLDLSTITSNINSIVAVLPPGAATISSLAMTSLNADGQSLDDILQLVAAMVNGKFILHDPVPGHITFYKRDSLTPLFEVAVTTDMRERI